MLAARKLLRNLSASWLGLAAEVLTAFLLTPFIVRSLGVETYGVWSLLIALVGYLGLIDMGIRGAVGRYVNYYMARRDPIRLNQVVMTSLAFLTIGALAVFVISFPIGTHFRALFPKAPPDLAGPLAIALPLLAINLWLAFVTSVLRVLIEARERFDLTNLLNIGALAIRTTGTVAALRAGGGLVALAAVVLLSNAALLVFLIRAVRRLDPALHLSPTYIDRERFREMWRFGLASFTARTASQVVYQSGPLLVMWFFGASALGVYSVATMLIGNARRVIEQLGVVLNPSIMKTGAIDDYAQLRTLFLWYGRIGFYLAILAYCGIIVLGQRFLRLWMGPEFDAAVPILTILSFGELATLLGNAGGSVLFSLGRVRFNVAVAVAEAFANVALAIVLVVGFGASVEAIALAGALAMGALRGGAMSWYTARSIALPYLGYLGDVGVRAIMCTFATLLLFRHLPGVQWAGWPGFFIDASVAAAIYLLGPGLLIFPRAQLSLGYARIRARLSR